MYVRRQATIPYMAVDASIYCARAFLAIFVPAAGSLLGLAAVSVMMAFAYNGRAHVRGFPYCMTDRPSSGGYHILYEEEKGPLSNT